ncbi:MAG TPA: glycosyltransferase family 2 protein, partial [Rhodocyclaceae bacterium]|nr:glycosyltransferase family 2 protein [Rhodocyclaceae bacterium]
VIIIDNASTDDSATVAARAYPEFTFIWHNENGGFAAANNYAARMADDCEWLALLNPDAYAAADWLENLHRAKEVNPGFAFFGCTMLMALDPERIDGIGDAYHMSGLAWRTGHGELVVGQARETKEIFAPCAAAAFYRRADFLAAGGFDEDFFCYMEDVDLGFRLRLLGSRCMVAKDAIVHHVGSAITGGRNSNFAVYYGHRNLVWAFIKNIPGSLFWLLLPLHLAMNLLAILWFMLRGQAKTILRAKLDALKGLPSAWKKRHDVQSKRVVAARTILELMDKQLIPFKRIALRMNNGGKH